MSHIRNIVTTFILGIILSNLVFGQFFNEGMSSEALRPFITPGGFGAAAFNLQNNALLARDISSTQFNPAFLININRPKAGLAGNYLFGNFESTLMGSNRKIASESSTMTTDYFGFAYPVPVYQGAMVLAFSYEPSAYYYSTLKSSGTAGISIGDVAESMDIEETGAMNTLRFIGAVEFMPYFDIGLSMNFHNGNRSYESLKKENAEAADTDTEDYPDINYIELIKPEYNGFNMDFGMAYQSDNIKFGLRLSTPLKMHIHEYSEFTEDYIYDEAWSGGASWDTTYYYNIEYSACYPWEFAPSVAVKVGSLTLGADLVLHNWQDIEVDQLTNEDEINRDLYWNLRRTTDISIFAAIPLGEKISTRLAYRRIPSPYESLQNEDEEIGHLLGASVETILMKSVIMGISFQRSIGNQTVPHPYFGTYSEQSYTNNRLSLSLAILL
ncbi:MAG: hypothetical protein DRP96_07170 [Candidatus Neomarinimicrobiota bacterium]|nr:MAG: hypothetical protein DRP96_07170 [Candidatus Neomarinimicrobiota bacterium]